jgi:hypothetical protein
MMPSFDVPIAVVVLLLYIPFVIELLLLVLVATDCVSVETPVLQVHKHL